MIRHLYGGGQITACHTGQKCCLIDDSSSLSAALLVKAAAPPDLRPPSPALMDIVLVLYLLRKAYTGFSS